MDVVDAALKEVEAARNILEDLSDVEELPFDAAAAEEETSPNGSASDQQTPLEGKGKGGQNGLTPVPFDISSPGLRMLDMEGLRKENISLKRQLDIAKTDASRVQRFFEGVEKVNEELQASILMLMAAKKEHEEEIETLKSQLEKPTAKVVQLEDQLQTERRERETLEQRLADLTTSKTDRERNLEAQIQDLKEENKKLKHMLTAPKTPRSKSTFEDGSSSSSDTKLFINRIRQTLSEREKRLTFSQAKLQRRHTGSAYKTPVQFRSNLVQTKTQPPTSALTTITNKLLDEISETNELLTPLKM